MGKWVYCLEGDHPPVIPYPYENAVIVFVIPFLLSESYQKFSQTKSEGKRNFLLHLH